MRIAFAQENENESSKIKYNKRKFTVPFCPPVRARIDALERQNSKYEQGGSKVKEQSPELAAKLTRECDRELHYQNQCRRNATTSYITE